MKNPTHIALLGTLLLAASCTKQHDYNAHVTPDIDGIFSSMAPKPRTVSIDATTGGSFTGNSGTRYVFPPQSFVTADGTVVTGNVTVTATECLSQSDMAFSGMLPISGGKPLVSGGEFNINAKQGANVLRIAPGKKMTVRLPQNGPVPHGMGAFTSNGNFSPGDTMSINNWVPIHPFHAYCDSSATDTLTMITDTMGFINADQFLTPFPDYQDFKITLKANGLTIDSTIRAFALYDNYKSMMRLGYIGSIEKGGIINERHVPSIPVHFVAATIVNGELYAGKLGATPVTGENYIINLDKTTQTELKKMLDNN